MLLVNEYKPVKPIVKNSAFLMLNSAFSAILGFVFLSVITRYYDAEAIGLFSAIISSVSLLAILSKLGFDIGLIRFLSESDEPEYLINSCFIITGAFAILISILFLYSINIWAPPIKFISYDNTFSILFVIAVLFSVIYSLQSSLFIAKRCSEYTIPPNLMSNLAKIMLAIGFFSGGLVGILIAHTFGVLCSCLLGFFVLDKYLNIKPKLLLRVGLIKKIFKYSFGNYIAGIIANLPSLVLPLIVVNMLGASTGALFYIGWSIAQIIFIISGSVSTSFFAESSVNINDMHANLKKCLGLVYVPLLLVILIIFVSGDYLIKYILGSIYSYDATKLLFIFSISSIPLAFNEISINRKKIEKDVTKVFIYSLLLSSSILLFSGYLLSKIGLLGVGTGFLIGQIITFFIIIIDERFISKRH